MTLGNAATGSHVWGGILKWQRRELCEEKETMSLGNSFSKLGCEKDRTLEVVEVR